MQSHNTHMSKPIYILTRNTNMASSLPCFGVLTKPLKKCKNHRSTLQVRAQSFRDEGRSSSNMVDGNLRILRERIEELRNKERLERCCCRSELGWNYAPGYNHHIYKREKMLAQWFDLVGLIGGTAGLAILTSTSFLCLVSLILHMNQPF